MIIQRYPYKDGYHDGLFSYSRQNEQQLFESFNLTSYDSFSDEGFCAEGYSAHNVSALIDGNEYTCWANLEANDSRQYFILDIGAYKEFQLITLEIRTVCSPPNEIIIYGSHDNSVYEEVCVISKTFPSHQYSTSECYSTEYYQYFGFKQNGTNIDNFYRLHLSEIEFYGFLRYYYSQKTCSRNIKNFHIMLFFIFICLKSE